MEAKNPQAHRKYPRLRTRLALNFLILSVLAIGIAIAALYINFRQNIHQDLRQRVANLAAAAALQQNGDEFAAITSGQDPFYLKYQMLNTKISNIDPDIAYVYTMRKDDKGIYYVVDVGDAGGAGTAAFGQRYPNPSKTLSANFDTMTGVVTDKAIYTDEFGSFLGGYAPILASDGSQVGVIGVDLKAKAVLDKENQFLWVALGIFLVSIFVVALAGWLMGNRLTAPLSALAKTANEIAGGNLTRRAELKANTIELVELTNDFNAMANTVSELIGSLERRVADRTNELMQRTNELEVSANRNERRATQLQTVAEVARTIASVHTLETLLSQIAVVISERFGFYHVGIFLLDETRQYAVLSAANSPGGKRMLERHHQLKVSQAGGGIVGFVIATGNPRIALNTEADAVYFDNADLPETRSEIALPLKAREQIFGALDVQSLESQAFSQEDVSILTVLADQVGLAIENARTFEQTRQSLDEAEALYSQFLHRQWAEVARRQAHAGYRYNLLGTAPLQQTVQNSGIQAAIEKGSIQVYQDSDSSYRLAVPIKQHGEVIAVLNVQSAGVRRWDKDEIDIVQAAADRVALALENARLLEDSQRRAAKEQLIGEIATQISSSVNMDNILQTAVAELGRILPGADIAIQIEEESGAA